MLFYDFPLRCIVRQCKTTNNMSLRTKKNAVQKYPFIAFRPSSHLQENRIRNLAKKTGMSISEVVTECISAHLTKLEEHAGKVTV